MLIDSYIFPSLAIPSPFSFYRDWSKLICIINVLFCSYSAALVELHIDRRLTFCIQIYKNRSSRPVPGPESCMMGIVSCQCNRLQTLRQTCLLLVNQCI